MLDGHRQILGFAGTVRSLLGVAPCRIQVAALAWRFAADGIEVMLVTSRDTGRWVVPKGWPERSEALCQAAAREAGEEAGISGVVSVIEFGRYHYTKQRASGSNKACRVHVFPMEIDRVKEKWPERKERRRAWFSPAEAAGHVRETELADLILRFGKAHRQPPLPEKKTKRVATTHSERSPSPALGVAASSVAS